MVDIADWNDLEAVNTDLSATYDLVADLDSTTAGYDSLAGPSANGGSGWIPIGTTSTPFIGTFNGNGHSVSDMYIDGGEDLGLFARIDTGASVSGLSVLDADVNGGATNDMGVFSGILLGGTVQDCLATGTLTSTGAEAVGGFGGFIGGGITITRCGADVDVTNSFREVGGFGGNIRGAASLSECYALGSVESTDRVGGFAGMNRDADTSIVNCYSMGPVTSTVSTTDVGGFVGRMRDLLTVDKCYTATSSVTGQSSDSGGFVGTVSDTPPSNCFWDSTVSNQVGSAGATAKTTAEMQDITTYTDTATTGLDEAWDMADVTTWTTETWRIDDGNAYPELGWEFSGVTIAGTVTDRLSGDPVEGATVYLIDEVTDEYLDQTTTDATGAFSFSGVMTQAEAIAEYETAETQYQAYNAPFLNEAA